MTERYLENFGPDCEHVWRETAGRQASRMIQVLVSQVLLKGHKCSVEPGPRQAVLLSGMPFENLSGRGLGEQSINHTYSPWGPTVRHQTVNDKKGLYGV